MSLHAHGYTVPLVLPSYLLYVCPVESLFDHYPILFGLYITIAASGFPFPHSLFCTPPDP
jgi:hypothetical protein